MKVGDLVRVVCVDGWPLGIIVERRDHPSGYRIKHWQVLLMGDTEPHAFLTHQMEIVK
jgi:hypothetical protein